LNFFKKKKMRQKYPFFLSVILLVFFAACQGKQKPAREEAKPVITVSIPPQKFFVEQIAGDYFRVNILLPPGASPADFEPTPRQVQDLSGSEFYFFIGHLGFEKTWVRKFSDAAPGVSFVSCSQGIDLLRGDEDHLPEENESHNHRHGTDPHIWTSPENVKTIAKTICSALSEKHPDGKEKFEKNRDAFLHTLNQLDNQIRLNLADVSRSVFLIYHPALGYYARDYHLEQFSIEFEGKSPETAQMKTLIDRARKESISTIFIQTQFETDKAKSIAREINAHVVPVNPLAENWLDEMYSLTDKMKKALQ